MQALGLVLLVLIAPPGLAAGGSPRKRPASASAGTSPAGPVSPDKAAEKSPPVLKLDPFTIEGRIEKPKAIYSLQRAAPAFGELVPEESFLPKVLQSVEEDPF